MSADTETTASPRWQGAQRFWQRVQQWALAHQGRLLLGVVGLVGLLEAASAWRNWGTFDITIFDSFATTVGQVGPIDIYSLDEADAGLMVYNHPPLVGWWLEIVNFLTNTLGLRFGFVIRGPSVVAHALTVFLVYDMVRRRKGDLVGLASGLALAVSPTLIILAGYHGNNDPVLAMFLLASVWLLVDRRAPLLAGVAFGIAMSIKIIPVVVLPVLAVAAWKLGRRFLLRFAGGGLIVFALLWLPVFVFAYSGFREHVLGYDGTGFPRAWGLWQFGKWLGLPTGVLDWFGGPGTYVVLVLCAVLPAWLVRRDPSRAPAALGLAITAFLLLSPGWAAQYTAWVTGAIFLVEFWSALFFTVVGGFTYLVLYYQWRGDVQPLLPYQLPWLAVTWFTLLPVVVMGFRSFSDQWAVRPPGSATPTSPAPKSTLGSPSEDRAAQH